MAGRLALATISTNLFLWHQPSLASPPSSSPLTSISFSPRSDLAFSTPDSLPSNSWSTPMDKALNLLLSPTCPRRLLLSGLSSALAALFPLPPSSASVSKVIRLKDVENSKMQDALRAAVAGDLEKADELFSELIQQEPENASVWSNRGSVRISLKLYEEARADLTKAVQLAPGAPVPFLNRAIALEALGRYDEAIADCKTAIENDPEEYAAWFNLGNVDARINKYDDALAAYGRASLLAPGIAGYRLKEALVLFQVQRSEEARKLMQGLVRKYPNYAEAHAALAAVLWSEGERSRAEEQFSEATKREPLYADIRWISSELLWPPNMVKAMRKFLAID